MDEEENCQDHRWVVNAQRRGRAEAEWRERRAEVGVDEGERADKFHDYPRPST